MKSQVLFVCGFVAGLCLWVPSLANELSDIESLMKQAQEGATFERLSAIRALARSGDPRAFDQLAGLLKNADSEMFQVEAARALGDLKDPRAIPVLIDALAFSERRSNGTESKGRAAAWALKTYEKAAVLPLCKALSNTNPIIREQAGIILGWFRDPRSIDPLIEALADSTFHIYRYTFERFIRFGQPAMDGLVGALEDDRPWLRIGAARSLAAAKYHSAADPLAVLLTDLNSAVRYEAALALTTLGDRRGLDVLLAALSDVALTNYYYDDVSRLSRALGKLGGRRVVDALIDVLPANGENAQLYFARALGEIGDTLAVLPLIELSDRRKVHGYAVRALGKIGDRRAVEPLISLLSTGRFVNSESVVWALGELRDPRAVDVLIRVATRSGGRWSHGGPDPAGALIKIGEPAREAIMTALERDSLQTAELEFALVGIAGPESLIDVFQSPISAHAYQWRSIMGRDDVPFLIEGLVSPDAWYRKRCVRMLREFKDPRSVEPLCAALRDPDAEMRRAVAWALALIGDTRAVEPLMRALDDEDTEVHRAIRGALVTLRDRRAVDALEQLAWDKNADSGRRFRAWRSSKVLQMNRIPYDHQQGWQSYRSTNFHARWRAQTGEIYIVGDFGSVWVCRDSSYEQMESGATHQLLSVWGTSSKDVFAVGKRGTIIHYNGSKWATMPSGTQHDLYRIVGTAPDHVFAIGWAGTILHFDGARWGHMSAQTQLTLHDIWAFSSDDIYVVGDGGIALHFDGIAWDKIDTPTRRDLLTIWADAEHNIYAGGTKGTVLHNWELIQENALGNVHRMWGLDSGLTSLEAGRDVYQLVDGVPVSLKELQRKKAWVDSITAPVVADMDRRSLTVYGPVLLRGLGPDQTSDFPWISVSAFWTPSAGHLFGIDRDWARYFDGVEWFGVKLDTTGSLVDISGVSPSSFYVLGNRRDDVIHFSGSEILNISPGTEDALFAIWAGSEKDVFVVGKRGLIMRYNGYEWDQMRSPAKHNLLDVWGATPKNVYAVGARGTLVHYNGVKWRSQKSKTKLNLNAVWGFDAKNIFAVGQAGKILRYNGRRWRSMDSGVTNDLTDVWGTTADHVFACGYGGVIVHFDGTRWTQMYTGATGSFKAIGGTSATKIFAASSGVHRYFDSTRDVESVSARGE